MKTISIVAPCYNEEENVDLLYDKISEVMKGITGLQFELIFIDNASTDHTVEKIKSIIKKDKRCRLIVNARNFGHIRSPVYGLLQAYGDAVILIASDLQDPPEMILDFVAKWKEGYKIVAAVKTNSEESRILYFIRSMYYRLISRISDTRLLNNFTGFGLYDKVVMDALRKIRDPYPYFRGLIADIGFDIAQVEFTQPTRKRGITKNNFYTLYDMAMLGITSYSKVPLRLAVFAGIILSICSFLLALSYFIYKLLYWETFVLGLAPLVIGLFFFSSIQLLFVGLLGEYLAAVLTQVMNRPLVIEKERVNFNRKK